MKPKKLHHSLHSKKINKKKTWAIWKLITFHTICATMVKTTLPTGVWIPNHSIRDNVIRSCFLTFTIISVPHSRAAWLPHLLPGFKTT